MTLRERKQQAARDHVADAAAPLFIQDGYLVTTTRKIAGAAGVSEGTIFNLFGTKSAVLQAALRRALPDAPDVTAWVEDTKEMSDPWEVIRSFCVTGAAVADAALPLARVLLEAAAVDDDAAATWRAQEDHRFEDQQWLLRVLAERGWLRPDREWDDLARDLWVIAAPEIHLKWLDAGMDMADFQRWQHGALGNLLIDPGGEWGGARPSLGGGLDSGKDAAAGGGGPGGSSPARP